MKKYKVGLIGAGAIAGQYLKNAAEVYSDYFEIVTVADLNVAKAQERAEK